MASWNFKEKRDYDNEEDRNFRHHVRERDKCCQFPNCTRELLKFQVHHIFRWADNIYLRYEPTNGILLCRTCHKFITGQEWLFAQILSEIAVLNESKYQENH